MRLGTLGYRSLRSLCASLAAFHFKIRTSVNADALGMPSELDALAKPIRPAQFPRIESAFSVVSSPALRGLWGASVFKYDLHFNMKHRQRGA